MNYDEFAFFNQQLAAMLRDGISLEGALLRLTAEMRVGSLRSELEKLAADLSHGIPLGQALRARRLPDLYRQLLEVGVASQDLPGVLTLLADYYQRRQLIWTRLKGLMVYPLIVLLCAFLLSCFLSYIMSGVVLTGFVSTFYWDRERQHIFLGFWIPPIVLGLVFAAVVAAMTAPGLRRALRWRLPAFKEASVAEVGAAMALMLRSGVGLPEALALAEGLEKGTPAQREIGRWRERLAGGRGKFSEMAAEGGVFPPLFLWMVGHAGEDLGAGFQRASEIYQARAAHRTEMMLYAALPCAVLALGIMILTEMQPAFTELVRLMDAVGNF
ncbi:MAG TPA: type II secretion system F family protein [Verrucomicrobiae bacterium]|jgi:type II secretory pathway component PulF|nr:type II secretion system F family protein [Verrucomicrobiae bacterium]